MLDPRGISIARPYAKAVFDLAIATRELDIWSALLNQAALIVKEKPMQILLQDPRFDKMVAYECLLIACKSSLFADGENFLKLVALHQRLLILPEIKRLFDTYSAEQANHITAQAISVVPLTQEERQTLIATLEKHVCRRVTLDYHIDNHLLGGLVIRIGDLVIDSSVRGKLERLRTVLVN
jgi:F-type H+-transporting ATPase subunit delta